MAKRRGNMPGNMPHMPHMPVFPPDVLAAVNTMERSPEPLDVATAAIMHAALTRRPVPDYHAALGAERIADVVLAALWRRGMLR
jgi:hypothetical protein